MAASVILEMAAAETARRNARTGNAKIWVGRCLSALTALFLVLDAIMKFIQPAPVVEGFRHLGLPLELSTPIGVILLVCTMFYVIPRTAVLGAALLTGYLGGAVVTNLRVGEPLFTYVLPPVYFGAVLWIGLGLRDPRVRALIGARETDTQT